MIYQIPRSLQRLPALADHTCLNVNDSGCRTPFAKSLFRMFRFPFGDFKFKNRTSISIQILNLPSAGKDVDQHMGDYGLPSTRLKTVLASSAVVLFAVVEGGA